MYNMHTCIYYDLRRLLFLSLWFKLLKLIKKVSIHTCEDQQTQTHTHIHTSTYIDDEDATNRIYSCN